MQGYVVDQEMQEAVVIPQAGCGVRGGKVSSLHVGAARAVAAARVRAGGVRRRGREGEEGELHEWRVRGTASMPEKRGCPQIALFAQLPPLAAARGDGDSLRVWRGSRDAARRCVPLAFFGEAEYRRTAGVI